MNWRRLFGIKKCKHEPETESGTPSRRAFFSRAAGIGVAAAVAPSLVATGTPPVSTPVDVTKAVADAVEKALAKDLADWHAINPPMGMVSGVDTTCVTVCLPPGWASFGPSPEEIRAGRFRSMQLRGEYYRKPYDPKRLPQ